MTTTKKRDSKVAVTRALMFLVNYSTWMMFSHWLNLDVDWSMNWSHRSSLWTRREIVTENVVAVAAAEMEISPIEKSCTRCSMMNDDWMMTMRANIDFDTQVEHWQKWMNLDHENYFDAATEENHLVVIQTRRERNDWCYANRDRVVVTFFSSWICDDCASAEAMVCPRIVSKWDDNNVDDEFNGLPTWLLRRCCCFISSCWARRLVDDDVDDGCPILVHCFPPPTEPNSDGEFEPSDDGTVDIPPLLFTCK